MLKQDTSIASELKQDTSIASEFNSISIQFQKLFELKYDANNFLNSDKIAKHTNSLLNPDQQWAFVFGIIEFRNQLV